ncbi:MAG TPA: hypothetical protein VKR32_06335 [Puia sp.]|nr:hypothetical protein [Puia sp.]
MINFKFVLPAILAGIGIFSACKDTDTKAVPLIQDSTTGAGSGSGSGKSGTDSSGSSSEHQIKNPTTAIDSVATKGKHTADSIKTRIAARSVKKKSIVKDSSLLSEDDNALAAKKAKISSADNTRVESNTGTLAAKPFVSKYGTLPRNITTDNISEFLIAFQDKTIPIKIYFNADPDADMQNVKSQIAKVLKKSGYSNIADQSLTLHPMHVPKDIHYELQHDGSVIIWIPPASVE